MSENKNGVHQHEFVPISITWFSNEPDDVCSACVCGAVKRTDAFYVSEEEEHE